jgi:hypothetical protein
MLEKLGFEQLVEETLTVRRLTRAMPVYRFVLAMVDWSKNPNDPRSE